MRKIMTVGFALSLIAGLVVCNLNQSSEAKRQNILKDRESALRTTSQKLSNCERGRLERRQNKLSNKIHAQKHDKQKA